MTTEPDEPQTAEPETKTWGTWEELLLTCAVHRHGTASWPSVAAEVRNRTSVAVTPINCEIKYTDLKNRYGGCTGSVPLLDELRKIRVQELKREVERCDLSILSLQHKVKRLEEERESSDLEKIAEETGKTGEKAGEPVELSVEPVSGEDGRSVNQSNSTRSDNKETGLESKEPEKGEPESGEPEPVGDDSCNGSSDSVEKNPVQVEPDRVEVKENSDVQSSAKKDEESDKAETEKEDRLVKRSAVKSEPLVRVLEMVRSHKLGSVFERRLMNTNQDLGDQNWIRQHLDIETIQSRLEEGRYSDLNTKFFRDLLLLFNNAILSFAKNSPEFSASIELRNLISQEIDHQRRKKTDMSSRSDPEPSSDPSLLKRKISGGPIIVCRKRSSITGQKATLLEDKPLFEWKQSDKSSAKAKESGTTTKTRTSDRVVTGSGGGSTKNGKNKNDTKSNNNKTSKQKAGSTLLESLKNSDSKTNSSKGGGAENKRSGKGRQEKERESPVKRSNLRAAGKRAVPPPVEVSGKRSREGGGGGGGSEVGSRQQHKKRRR